MESLLEKFVFPQENVWTIYTKSNCGFCTKVKKLLAEKNESVVIIECDEWIATDGYKELFLYQMENIIGREYRTFPMVFKNKVFVGGFTDTEKLFINKNQKSEIVILDDF